VMEALSGRKGGAMPVERVPRRLDPCSDDCPGWGVFLLGGMVSAEEHGTLAIERCDECWEGVEGAPSDSDFAKLEVCQKELARQRELLEAGRSK
jgi:hypothetical protein